MCSVVVHFRAGKTKLDLENFIPSLVDLLQNIIDNENKSGVRQFYVSLRPPWFSEEVIWVPTNHIRKGIYGCSG